VDFASVRAVQVKLRSCVREGWDGMSRGIVKEMTRASIKQAGIVDMVIGASNSCFR
jgi:hypothetical protein